jgi:hypothetical protein
MKYPSNGDFEVMPRGTMEEIRILRQLSRDLLELDRKYGINTPQAIRSKINEIGMRYLEHVEKFPL